MVNSDRLQTIKEYDLVSIIKEIADGETVNIDTVMDDIEWLIKQAEKVEGLIKENERLLKTW